MRKFITIMGLCLFCSCNWLTSKEEKTNKIVEQEMQNINWNEIDEYPLFDACDETVSKEKQKECFERVLLMHFSMALQDFDFVLDFEVNDTVYVDFIINKEGLIAVQEVENSKNIKSQMPEFNALISTSLKGLPKVSPALKRGVPVSAKFRIPIILNTN